MSAWAPGLQVSLKPGSPDPNGVGAVRTINAPGPMPAIVEEITAFEPEARLGYRAIAGVPLKNYGGDVELRAVSGGTEITYSVFADERVPVLEQLAAKAISKTLLTALARRAKATA